jgi:uncharacterized protein YjbJ (UPF0337 family)
MGSVMDKAKGALKEAVGAVGGDKSLEAEGKLDQAKGSAKAALDNLKERVKDAVADHENAAAERLRDAAEDAERSTEER